jgi:hypothetical protein
MDPRLQEAARQLGSWLPQRRSEAERLLRGAGPDALEPLVAYFEREERKHLIASTIWGLVFFLSAGLNLLSDVTKGGTWHRLLATVWHTIALGGGAAWLVSRWHLRRIERALLLLTSSQDKRVVGPLLSSLDIGTRKTRELARNALSRLLPLLTDADRNTLIAHQETLRQALRPYHEVYFDSPPDLDFLHAVLHALEVVGTEEAAVEVEALANSPTRFSTRRPVVAAAKEAAGNIHARLEREKPGQNLLRAAEANGEVLLRPASGTADGVGQELLRPVEDVAQAQSP